MATEQGKALRLVDYLVLVGPEQRKDEAVLSYCDVSEAVILRQFPQQCWNDCCVCIKQAPFFCQPQNTYLLEANEIKYHTFMLTDTETNNSLYGVCYTFPHETKSHDTTNVAKETVLLSVCLLSQHFYLNFFQSCLEALASLVEKCYDHITWLDLFYPGPDNTASNASSTGLLGDIENWIDKLLNLELPASPGAVLEVTVDLGAPLTVSRPLPSEWPPCGLSVRQLFQHIQPHTVNETLQLILNEQKVVICSRRHDVVSRVVLTLVSLLYPLEYVYPVIPLLPARLNQAAEFLMVPVPYIIGTTTDLISELAPANLEDVYVIDIDAKKIKNPQVVEGLPRLPLNSLELQANIKKILDSVQPYVQVKGSLVIIDYEDKERIDMLIRQAFLDFVMSPQMLGLLPQHQTIVRLFPRSVVRLQSSCLLQAYNQLLPHESTSFIEKFITSQSVRCFLDWNLNPKNVVYLQYRQLVSGKPTSELCHRNREIVGVSLVEPDSTVYQLLLSSTFGTDDCTDSSSDEEEHQCLLSPWNVQQCIPNMVLPELRLTKPTTTAPKIKISDHHLTCQQWMEKLLGPGRSIPHMNTQHKQVLGSDSGRTKLLLLIERGLLGDCEASEVLWSTKPLEVTSIVFNKLLRLAKSMVKNIDKDFSKNPHCHLTSAVILLRLSCLVCLEMPPLTSKKPSDDELMMLKSPVLSCGDNMTPFVSSVSSCTSSNDEDDVEDDLSAGARSSPSTMTSTFPSHDNNKFLHHDLFIKTSSQCACFANDEFWKTVFFSAVNMLRDKLGWNEKTSELYQRYLSVGNSEQQEMAEEEDELLTSVLINLATFMSVAGMCKDKCIQSITNLVMYCRLGHRSDTITSQLKARMSGKNTSITPLCINKSIIFMGHLGRNKLGTACNVEVWERVLVLRRVLDNEIILRIWRNDIGTSLCDTHGELVVLHYKDDRRPPVVLHTKQFHQLHETIIS